ncbi:MAG: aminotransferase class I/II-fold pyridoxal phosphate-dependent enzyme [Pyrinomonadaceae bacterium]
MTERSQRVLSSDYMYWAKTRSQARFNLATSGLVNYPLAQLPARIEDIELSGPSFYGYAPLQQALAAKCGVPEECVVAATGTSMANHLAMASVLEPGDEVLVEHPTYELLVSLARYLGARVVRFPRRFEAGFLVEPREVERCATSRTRLIVLTNLHNPTSVHTPDEVLRQVGEIARGIGARVLVDEVYLDAMFERASRSAVHLGEEFIATNSLTKVYGLSGLRCGWALAPPELARRMWRLNDLFGVIPAHPAERLSRAALDHLPALADWSRTLLQTNRQLLDSFLDTRADLDWVQTEHGTVAFPRLKRGDVDALCTLLTERYDTSVVPGKFFEMPRHFRIGIGGETAILAGGLERLAAALDGIASRVPTEKGG